MKKNFTKSLVCLLCAVYVQVSFCSLLLATTPGVAQTTGAKDIHLSLTLQDDRLPQVFHKIEEQSGFSFVYNQEDIDPSITLRARYRQTSLYNILIDISRDARLSFKRVNNNINVRKLPPYQQSSVLEEVALQVSGTVTSSDGSLLPGVNILVKNTNVGTVSDVEGRYSLRVPNENDTLIFSSIGMLREEVPVNGRATIDVMMVEDISQLDEIVVVGYGSVKKSDFTGAVGSIKAAEINKQPVARVDQALQGRIAGVQVSTASGAPGSGASIRIRGGNSITAGNEPLYVIDGFIGGGDLNSISPNDIASIEVLKDASATAIYGSRGSNGVILITTKRGVQGEQFGVSLDSYVGVQTPLRKIDMLNGPEFADYRNEYADFLGNSLPFPEPDQVENTDWQDILFRNALITNHTLSAHGSTETNNYYAALNYLKQDGIQLGSGFDRYQFRFNFDQQLGTFFKLGASLNASRSHRENPRASALGFFVLPTSPVYLEDGSFHRVDPINGSTYNSPIAQDELIMNDTYRNNGLGNIYAQVTPIEGLNIKSTFGFDINTYKQNSYNSVDLPTNFEAARGGQAAIDTRFVTSIQNENTVSYNKSWGIHSFDVVGGWTSQRYNYERLNTVARGLGNDATLFNAIEIGDPELLTANSDEEQWSLLSGLYRLNYTINDRYLFTVSGRHDGSSRLAEGNRWQFFPAAAVAWRVSEEGFMANLPAVSNLKLRASYGKTGSQSIDPYATLARLNTVKNYIGDQQVTAFVPGVSADPNLTWEVTTQYDIGLETGFLDNRLTLEVDYYYKKTSDLLLERELPFQTGFSTRLENVGELENKGVDVTIGAVIVSNNDFSWSSDLTISANRNKILSLSDGKEFIENGRGARLIVGESVNAFFGARYLGLWQENDPGLEDRTPGSLKFEDLNGDGTITALDGQVIGEGTPNFYGGINNVLTYKNFTLSAFFDFSQGNDIYDLDGLHFNTGHASNVYGKFRNRWTPTNTNTDVPRAGAQVIPYFNNYPGTGGSSYDLYDGSYVRLRNLNVQYTLPLASEAVKNLSIYATATNLFTITQYQGFSPDVSADADHPTRRGFDSNGFPPARVYTIGIRADF